MTVPLSVFVAGTCQMAEAASNPSTACRGQEVEMVTPGGEVAFVGRIVADSLQLREQIRWYTSMVSAIRHQRPPAETECVIFRGWMPALPQLGRKNSLRELLSKLRQAGIVNVRTAEFFQVSSLSLSVCVFLSLSLSLSLCVCVCVCVCV